MVGSVKYYHAESLQRVVQVKKTEEDENIDEEVLEEELIALSQGLSVLFMYSIHSNMGISSDA